MKIKTFKILSTFLSYPSKGLQDAMQEGLELLEQEKLLSDQSILKIKDAALNYQSMDLLDWQEQYVQSFDRIPSCSLFLFEHIHGDSRDRGQAMVDLMQVYEDQGLKVVKKELPDYLPLFLEYLALLDLEKAIDLLGEIVNILSVLERRLEKHNIFYQTVLSVLIKISKTKPDLVQVEKAMSKVNKAQEKTQRELDEEWEEKPAFGCPHEDLSNALSK